MGRRGEESEDGDWGAEEEDALGFGEDDDDFDDDEEILDDEIKGRRVRTSWKSPSRRVMARRLIEQVREQRELHKSLAEFDDWPI